MLTRDHFKSISDDELIKITINKLNEINLGSSVSIDDEFLSLKNNPHKDKILINVVLEALTELNKTNKNIDILKQLKTVIVCRTTRFTVKLNPSLNDGIDVFNYHKDRLDNFKIEYDVRNKKDFDVLDFVIKIIDDEGIIVLKENLTDLEKDYLKILSEDFKKTLGVPIDLDLEQPININNLPEEIKAPVQSAIKQLNEVKIKYAEKVDEIINYISNNKELFLKTYINNNTVQLEVDFNSIPPVKGEEDILNAMEWIEMIFDKGLIKKDLITFDQAVKSRLKFGISNKGINIGLFGSFTNLTPNKVAGIILNFKNKIINKNPPYIFGGFVFNSIDEAKKIFVEMMQASFLTYDDKEEDIIKADPEIELEKGRKGLEFFEKNFPEVKEELKKFNETHKHYSFLQSNEGKALYKCEVGKDSLEWIIEFNKTKEKLNDIYKKDIVEKIGINKIREKILNLKGKLRIVKGINDKDKPLSEYKLDVDFIICEGNFRNTKIKPYSKNIYVYAKVKKVTLDDIKNNKNIKIIYNKNRKQTDPTIDQKTYMQVKTFELLNKKFPPQKEWSEEVKIEGYESHWSMSESIVSNLPLTDKEIIICFPTLPYALMNEGKIVNKNGKKSFELGPMGKKLAKILTQASKDKYNYLKKEVEEYCNKLKNRNLAGSLITVYNEEKRKMLEPENLNYIRKLLGMLDCLKDINEEETTKNIIISEFSKQKKKGMYNNSFCKIEIIENKNPTAEDLFLFSPTFNLFEYWESVGKYKYWDKYKDWLPDVDWTEIDFISL